MRILVSAGAIAFALSTIFNSGSEAAEPGRLIAGGVLKPAPTPLLFDNTLKREPKLVPGGALMRQYGVPKADPAITSPQPAYARGAETPRPPAPRPARRASPPATNQAPSAMPPQDDGQVKF
jgi:hypothetical protein